MVGTYYICYNQVSYLVASEHARRSGSHNALVLFAPERVQVQARYSAVRHRRLNRLHLALACMAGWFRSTTIYVPHHRTSRLVAVLMRIADSVRLIDDGLDTLRESPNNIDVRRVHEFDEFLTFHDYPRLASWTDGLAVNRVCGLAELSQDERPPMPCSGYKTIVVQSPGVDLPEVQTESAEPLRSTIVFLHSNPAKRGQIPLGYSQVVLGAAFSLERTVNEFAGTVISGETMVTVQALFQPHQCDLIVQMSRSQYENLKALHDVLADSTVKLLVT